MLLLPLLPHGLDSISVPGLRLIVVPYARTGINLGGLLRRLLLLPSLLFLGRRRTFNTRCGVGFERGEDLAVVDKLVVGENGEDGPGLFTEHILRDEVAQLSRPTGLSSFSRDDLLLIR